MDDFKSKEKLRECLEVTLKRYTGDTIGEQREYTYDFGIHWHDVSLTDAQKETLIDKALQVYLDAKDKHAYLLEIEARDSLEKTYIDLLVQNSYRFLSDVIESLKSENGDTYNFGPHFENVPLSVEQREHLIYSAYLPDCGGISGNFPEGAAQNARMALIENYERHYGRHN